MMKAVTQHNLKRELLLNFFDVEFLKLSFHNFSFLISLEIISDIFSMENYAINSKFEKICQGDVNI